MQPWENSVLLTPSGRYMWLNYILLLFSCSVMSNSLWSHGPQRSRPSCPSPSLRACSNSCPLSQWCHPTISSSIVSSSSCLQFFLASGSFLMSRLFKSVVQCIRASASASVLLMNIQDWFPLRLTGLISLLSKGLLSLLQHHSSKALILWPSASCIHDYWKKPQLWLDEPLLAK